MLVFSALESFHVALAIMTNRDMPKQLYQEEEMKMKKTCKMNQLATASDLSARKSPANKISASIYSAVRKLCLILDFLKELLTTVGQIVVSCN